MSVRRAFTLIELLVVISIVAVLSGLSMAAWKVAMTQGKFGRTVTVKGMAARPWQSRRLIGYTTAAAEIGAEILAPRAISYGVPHNTKSNAGLARLVAGDLADILTGPAPPDGIMTINDGHAGTVMTACALLHCRVHADIAVAGYGQLWDDLVDRTLCHGRPFCTVDKHNDRIGRGLADLVIAQRDGRLAISSVVHVIPPTLVEGQ